MATSISVTAVNSRYITVKATFTVGGSHTVFISYYSDYATARYNMIMNYGVAGTGSFNITFSNLTPNTTYYIYAVGDNVAQTNAHTPPASVQYNRTITASSKIAKTSDNKRLGSNYGATAWGGIWKRMDNIGVSDISAIARIEKSINKIITGRARIQKENTATITGIANIVRIEGANITGRARIKVTGPEKLPENWNYGELPEPENWNKADKTATGWSEVEKDEEEWTEIDKGATSWSSSNDAGPEEWTYPLEDAG